MVWVIELTMKSNRRGPALHRWRMAEGPYNNDGRESGKKGATLRLRPMPVNAARYCRERAAPAL